MRPSGIWWRRFLVGFSLLLLSFHQLSGVPPPSQASPYDVVIPSLSYVLVEVLEINQYTAVRRRSPPFKKQNKKPNHLVLGPAAGPKCLQCQALKLLGMELHFATVFTVYNNTTGAGARAGAGLVTVGNSSYTKTETAIAVLNVFINFIQVTMPRSNVFILTDPASDLSLRRNSFTVYPIEGEYSWDILMLQRIRSYITFLETRLQHPDQNLEHVNHYIFTDSDIAVVGDLGKIFEDHSDFDVALTFRNNKEQPPNSGFIAVRGTRDAMTRAKMFLMKVLEVYSSRYMKASRMQGDQLALAWVLRSHPNFDMRRFTKPRAF